MALKKTSDNGITVMELTNRQIYQIIAMFQDTGEKSVSDIFNSESGSILEMCCDADKERLLDMAPSELETVFNDFREVNAVLFKAAAALNIDKLLDGLKNIIVPTILKDFKADYGNTE